MEKNEYLGQELLEMGLESAKALLVGKTVTLSADGSPHVPTYAVEDVLSPINCSGIAVIIKVKGHAFWGAPVGNTMRLTINTEGG